MRAVISDGPGTYSLEEIEKPFVPDDGVLVRVHASSVNPVDLFPVSRAGYVMRRMSRQPKRMVLGTDFAGTVEGVGKTVSKFQPGDEVFGGAQGAYADYVCLSEQKALALKPSNVSFEHAGGVTVAAVTALQAVRDHGQVKSGQKVLINGASGGVGTFTVQIAKAFGAEVTGVCSPDKVELARSLGADHVIDYTKEDFTRGGEHYDVMLDIAGSKSWTECARVLDPKGTYVLVGASAIMHGSAMRAMSRFATVRLSSMRSSQKVAMFIAKLNQSDMVTLQELMEAGRVTPVIDRCYELSQAREAFDYFEEGHARGKIVIGGIATR